MKRLKNLVQRLSSVIQHMLQPISQSEYRKQYRNYQVLVDNLLRAEKGLTKGKERRRTEYEAVRTDAIILRKVIEQRADAIKFDFLIENLRGIALRSSLVIKNIELNTRNTNYSQLANLRVSGFRRGDMSMFSSLKTPDDSFDETFIKPLPTKFKPSSNVVNFSSKGIYE